MFIGLTGPLCSGKHTVAKYLVDKHNFTYLSLNDSDELTEFGQTCVRFNTLKQMQIYVTERWLENFVTCDVDGNGLWLLKYVMLLRLVEEYCFCLTKCPRDQETAFFLVSVCRSANLSTFPTTRPKVEEYSSIHQLIIILILIMSKVSK
jgi:hypothetical protein